MFDLIIYIGYRIYSVLSRIFPLKIAYKIADFIGFLIFMLQHRDSLKRAKIIQRIYKGRSSKLICRNIQLFNRDLVDFFKSGRLNRGNIDNFAKITGLEYLEDALKKKKGIIFASAHMGGLEMAGIIYALKGYPIYGMVWNVGNRYVAKMFEKIRKSKGVGTVKTSSLRQIMELLHDGSIIGIMLDVNGGSKGVHYNLWGYNVRLPRGPAAISKYTGAELLVVITLRNKDGGYNIYIEKPELKGNEEEITIELFEIVKKYIEKYSDQWHWLKYFFENS